jgi:3-hydroxyisobutyrate dehydrogenase-like beta-hydroxyacid dehydrogenase
MSMRVAVVGTGRMGAAMVTRLGEAGHAVTAWNRSRERAAALGVPVAATAAEAAAHADVVLVSLADDAALAAVYTGPDGLLAGLRAGTVVADASTVRPETIRGLGPRVAATGADLLDTPVSGSVPLVQRGALAVMVGGDAAALERARPVLDALAAAVFHLGALGSGAVMKLVVNTVVLAFNQALSEALVVAERAGLRREDAYEVFGASAVAAPFVAYKKDAFLHPESAPTAFALELVAKDLGLAADLAAGVGVPVAQLAVNRETALRAVAAGLGDRDMSAVADLLRTEAGGDPAPPRQVSG